MTADDVAVLYIARGADGDLDRARRFINSYKSKRAGLPHSLKVITKGWGSQPELGDLRTLFESVQSELLPLPDDGFDVGAYFRAASHVVTEWIICLNTHSEILADDWVRKLVEAASRPGVGAAGATGSWESHYTNHTRFTPSNDALGKIKRYAALLRYRYNYLPFPNAHLRTNAFTIRRSHLIAFAAQTQFPVSKEDAYAIESGRRGLTAFLLKQRLRAVVCGADGEVFSADKWPVSKTFFSGRQSNLLIGDKQTRRYLSADARQRFGMQVGAWGIRSAMLSHENGLSEE